MRVPRVGGGSKPCGESDAGGWHLKGATGSGPPNGRRVGVTWQTRGMGAWAACAAATRVAGALWQGLRRVCGTRGGQEWGGETGRRRRLAAAAPQGAYTPEAGLACHFQLCCIALHCTAPHQETPPKGSRQPNVQALDALLARTRCTRQVHHSVNDAAAAFRQRLLPICSMLGQRWQLVHEPPAPPVWAHACGAHVACAAQRHPASTARCVSMSESA